MTDPAIAGPLAEVRALCVDLPEVSERLSHGEPTWFVRGKKVFVNFAGRHHDDRVALWCASLVDERDALVAARPTRFFVPPYVGGRGWLGVYLNVPDVDWAEVDELIRDAYRLIAPKRLVAVLEQSEPEAGRPEPDPGQAGT